MSAIDTRLKDAWDAGVRFGLDRAAERMAAEGVGESALLDALERLLMEIRAAGADDETEERIMGVMDRLTGWCHEANHIQTSRPAAGQFADEAADPARVPGG